MEGTLSIEKGKDGFVSIIFSVKQKEDVNGLTADMIGMGLELLYEPRNTASGYESCVICDEKTGIRIAAGRG